MCSALPCRRFTHADVLCVWAVTLPNIWTTLQQSRQSSAVLKIKQKINLLGSLWVPPPLAGMRLYWAPLTPNMFVCLGLDFCSACGNFQLKSDQLYINMFTIFTRHRWCNCIFGNISICITNTPRIINVPAAVSIQLLPLHTSHYCLLHRKWYMLDSFWQRFKIRCSLMHLNIGDHCCSWT